MLRPELQRLQRMYDEYMDEKTLRHQRAQRELEDRLYQEDFEGLSEVIREAHAMFRGKQATKMELRGALRQYGSPKFSEMWEIIPYNEEKKTTITYEINEEANEITFFRTGWNWGEISEGVEELTFKLTVSENTGLQTVTWEEHEETHSVFSFYNLSDIEEVLN